MPFSSFTTKTNAELLQEFRSLPTGLTHTEAAQRLVAYGRNELARRQIHWWQIWTRQFRSSFIYLLVIAGAVAFFLGDRIESGLIALFIVINSSLGFYQEYRSEQALRLLKKFIQPRSQLIRDGVVDSYDSAIIVPGDILKLTTGDVLPADVRFLETQDLTVDESALTGESVPAQKIAEPMRDTVSEIFQAKNIGFSGTAVIGGTGTAIVIATGSHTQIGSIAKLASSARPPSVFEQGLKGFSHFLIRLVVLMLSFIFIANLLLKGTHINIPELIVFSLALTVSVIPEALPIVVTVALSRGALQLAKNRVVVKRLSAIEDLGSIEILCTDKTGTITENKLSVADIRSLHPETCLTLAALGSSLASPSVHGSGVNAFDAALSEHLADTDRQRLIKIPRLAEIPFDPLRRFNSVLVDQGAEHTLIVRGAPEHVIGICPNLVAQDKQNALDWMRDEGKRGRRVLAIASKNLGSTKTYHETDERDLTLAGLISFADPIKPSAVLAIQQAKQLGVTVKILTGDAVEVAGAVARQIGLLGPNAQILTGDDWDHLPTHERLTQALATNVFARLSPEQKFQIIQTLEANKEIGFVGDGINDAPALKTANVGLAVAEASDIAREAADIILLQRSLHTIVNGIRQGRQTFANVVKYINISLSSNFGNFYSIGIASLFIPFLPMLPIQVLLENLLSDFPAIAISTDTVDSNELRRPKQYQIKNILLLASILGIVSSLFDFIFFRLFYKFPPGILQTNWFLGSLLTEIVFIFSIRTHVPIWKARRPSTSLVLLAIAVVVSSFALIYSRIGERLFHFSPPSQTHLLMIIGLVLLYLVTTEAIKLMYLRTSNKLALAK